ncbi:hypothetical protein EV356DRAFT_534152 [Viridothelium virens]|uniref:Uncharacterized protein n=1 Tax=Viridothelium virens TaxID=1048519 RepID=A0A6A6H6A5_VIRVR|nr:hypothetical protein EV356DRAFT_534152 [Viridothelium virens]
MGITDRLRSFLEHRRLENRYLNRSKRNTFISNAEYVNGEYVHAAPPTFPTPAPANPGVTPKSTRQVPAHPSPFYAASSSPTFSYYRRNSSNPASPTSLSQPSPTIAEACEAEVGSPTAVTPRARAFQAEASERRRRRWSAFVGSTGSEGLGWEGGRDEGGEEQQEQQEQRRRKERRRMSAIGEGGMEERDRVETDVDGGLRTRSGQGGQDSWLQRRRRSMLGRM